MNKDFEAFSVLLLGSLVIVAAVVMIFEYFI